MYKTNASATVTERMGLHDSVNANGGTYHGDLTKAVTHLVAASPKGKKYEYAGNWGIKTVSLEWIRDSLERGMALEESLYRPTMPLEERGLGAVNRKSIPSPNLGKRSRPDDPKTDSVNGGRRKLRRTASTRLESQSEGLWADIGSAEGLSGGSEAPEPRSAASEATAGLQINSFDRELVKTGRRESSKLFLQTDDGQKRPFHIVGFDERKVSLRYWCLARGT